MRVCVFGAGVIGSLYAGRLALAGHDVTVVARGDRLAAILEGGLVLENEASGSRDVANVSAVPRLDPNGSWDIVLVAIRKDQVEASLGELSANRATPLFVSMINAADGSLSLADAVGGERLAMYNLSSGMGGRFAEIVREMTSKIMELGPSPIRHATGTAARPSAEVTT